MFDLDHYLPYHLNRTGARLATAFGNDLRRFDLTLTMWRVLAVLWHHGELKVSDIVVDTTIEQSTLSRLLVTMEGKGLLSRERSRVDARTVVVNLTPRGRKVTKTLIPLALELERTTLKGFSKKEIDSLYAMLTRIFKNASNLPS